MSVLLKWHKIAESNTVQLYIDGIFFFNFNSHNVLIAATLFFNMFDDKIHPIIFVFNLLSFLFIDSFSSVFKHKQNLYSKRIKKSKKKQRFDESESILFSITFSALKSVCNVRAWAYLMAIPKWSKRENKFMTMKTFYEFENNCVQRTAHSAPRAGWERQNNCSLFQRIH